MASSYQPGGRRVDLESPNSRGYNPVQAYDSSESQLRAGLQGLDSVNKATQALLDNNKADLAAIVGLSETATKFMVERQKGLNDDQRKLGIADILNGALQPKPEALQTYRKSAQTLQSTAFQESEAINTLQETQPAAALEIRHNDPVVTGWREYGRAQGVALLASANAEFLLQQAMDSPKESITIQNPDGTVRTIAPANAQSPAEMNAAWAVVLQGFIGATGLDGINPLLLAEIVTPKILEAKSKIFEGSLNRIAKRQKEDAIEEVMTNLGGAVANANLTDPNNLHQILQLGSKEISVRANVSRGEANELVYKRLLQEAERRQDINAIARIADTMIAEDGSGSKGTLGIRFPGYAEDSQKRILTAINETNQQKKEDDTKLIESMQQRFELTIAGTSDPEAAKAQTIKYREALKPLVAAGVAGAAQAWLKLSERPLRKAGPGYLEALIQQSLKNPGSITEAQIDKDIADGVLDPGSKARFTFLTDKAEGIAKKYDAIAMSEAKKLIVGQLLQSNWKPEDVENANIGTRSFLLGQELKRMVRQGAAQDPNFSDADAMGLIEKGKQRASQDPIYTLNKKRSAGPGFPVTFMADPPPNVTVKKVNTSSSGATTRLDFTAVAPPKLLPGTVRPKDWVLNTDTLQEGIERYKATGSFPGESIPAVRATGLTNTEFIRVQSGAPKTLADLAKGLQIAIKDNPRSTPLELFLANTQLQRKALLNQRTPLGGIPPEAADLLRDLGKREGGAKGYEAANRGGAEDTPNGLPGLTSMSIDQVLAQRDIHHVGKYQLQLGKGRTLDSLKARMGLSGSEKFTPELQDRMAMELMYGGWKRPDLAAYLKGGGNLDRAVQDFNSEWEIGQLGFNVRPYLQRMRAAFVNRGAGAIGRGADFSTTNVKSVSWEQSSRGDSYQKGGVDIYFADKQFPALAQGTVVDVGSDKGFGLYVITEHVDPATGQKFHLNNAHLDSIYVKVGDSVRPGSILGRQGSTGNTSAGGVSSIDPLEPAPRGSKQTIPYRRPGVLRELVSQLIR